MNQPANSNSSLTSNVYEDVPKYDYNKNDITNNNTPKHHHQCDHHFRHHHHHNDDEEEYQEKYECELLADSSEKHLSFDEDAYIKSIMDQQNITEDDNNNSELSEFEKNILNKYLKEFEESEQMYLHKSRNEEDDEKPLDRFPVHLQSQTTESSFPTKCCDVMPVQQSGKKNNDNEEASTSCTTSTTSNYNYYDRSSTQVVFQNNNSRNFNNINNRSNNNNNRRALRRNFSIWVGVTSCVWGLLLYLDKSYF